MRVADCGSTGSHAQACISGMWSLNQNKELWLKVCFSLDCSTGEANTGDAIDRAGTDELDDFISAPQVSRHRATACRMMHKS